MLDASKLWLDIPADQLPSLLPTVAKKRFLAAALAQFNLNATERSPLGETVAEKPSFRSAFKKRRCLIPASGFYEWAKVGAKKLPHHFHMKDDSLFAFAGLWESWHPEKGDPIESCTIVTTEANELVKPYHDRMPVILPAKVYDEWLDAQATPDELKEMLVPFPAKMMTEEPVNPLVNNSRNEGPELLKSTGE